MASGLTGYHPGGETFEALSLARELLESIALDDDDKITNKAVHLGFSLGQDHNSRFGSLSISMQNPF